MARTDAAAKAAGRSLYAADVTLPGMAHAAVVRSQLSHAHIDGVDAEEAGAMPGVLGVFTAADVTPTTYGRSVRDVPILARERVRFVGERVAAVVAKTREQAEAAAAAVIVSYEELPAVFDPEDALRPGAPAIHEAPWAYPGAAVSKATGHNLQSWIRLGEESLVEAVLASAAHVVDQVYITPAGHHGYLEPHACLARIDEGGTVELWTTNKNPYLLREQLADCLGRDPAAIVVHPVTLGGDFGGKGSPMDAPLCVELARLTARPVKLVLRSSEDLIAANPRHPAKVRIRLGADDQGTLVAMRVDAVLDGGAYAGFKPIRGAPIRGFETAGGSYRIPAAFVESRIAYTNTVPKGHMRAPGAPQVTFAVESAIDELAGLVGLDPVELRRHNLLGNGEPNPHGKVWAEARGVETLGAALAAYEQMPVPAGWRHGQGIGVSEHATHVGATSLRLVPLPGGRIRVELPIPETGTGSATVAREILASLLGLEHDMLDIVHVGTADLPGDTGAGASRVTATLSIVMEKAAAAWRERSAEEAVIVETDGVAASPVTSSCVQVAQVAVDPGSGQVKVLEVLSAVDVADIVNPLAHRMQIEGGAAMGYGFACLEDLLLSEGQVWGANLGEFKIPSSRDVPPFRTVLVPGAKGLSALNVKAVGELTNVPTAAAIANAVAAAVGVRVRELPITAERVYWALQEPAGDAKRKQTAAKPERAESR